MCLLVEDAEPDKLIEIFSWIYIAGLFSAFFAPIAGLMIRGLTLIPTMRILYLFAVVSFTAKAIITYKMTGETRQGLLKIDETRDVSLFASLGEYQRVFRSIMQAPRTLFTAGIMGIMSITMLINGTFWSIIATEKLQIPAQDIVIFPFVKSLIMLFFFFMVIPRMRFLHFRGPLLLGFVGFTASQLVLVSAPVSGYAFLILSTLLEACSVATINPLLDQLTVITIDPQERARIQSILAVVVILITAPFGWIAGILSGLDRTLPFLLNTILFSMGAILVFLAGRTVTLPKPEH